MRHISNDKYYLKYLKYKNKYIQLTDKNNNLKGGMYFFNWLTGSKNTSTTDSANNVSYKLICKKTYFDLFYRDLPHVIESYINPKNKGEQAGGTEVLVMPNKNQSLVPWEILTGLLNDIYKDYPELNYKDRSNNLINYIIYVIINKILQNDFKANTPSDYTGKSYLQYIQQIFKYIGLYIYLKIYENLNIRGKYKYDYINNSYNLLEQNANTNNLMQKIIGLTSIIESQLQLEEFTSVMREISLVLLNSTPKDQIKQIILGNLNLLTTNIIPQYIDSEHMHFLDAIIHFIITNILNNSD